MDTTNEKVIDQLTVFITVDENGQERIINQFMLGGMPILFVTTQDIMIEEILPIAMELQNEFRTSVKILRFSNREDITDQYHKHNDNG